MDFVGVVDGVYEAFSGRSPGFSGRVVSSRFDDPESMSINNCFSGKMVREITVELIRDSLPAMYRTSIPFFLKDDEFLYYLPALFRYLIESEDDEFSDVLVCSVTPDPSDSERLSSMKKRRLSMLSSDEMSCLRYAFLSLYDVLRVRGERGSRLLDAVDRYWRNLAL